HPAHPRPAPARGRREILGGTVRAAARPAFRKEAMTLLHVLLRAAACCRAAFPAWVLAACLVSAAALFPATAVAQAAPSGAAPVAAPAAPAQPLPSVDVGNIGGQPVSMPLQVLALMTGITL